MPSAKPPLRCVLSIDVEEEGLFRGRYERRPRVANVEHLRRLDFCYQEFGQPLTLLVSYPVTQDGRACEILRQLREEQDAEIGAHLHHWNTPPYADLPQPEPVRCHLMPRDLLRWKLATLSTTIEEHLDVRPRSFRMGRFDYCPALTPLLAEQGYWVDSSMAPLRCELHGPDHFAERAMLYELGHGVLEAPITTVAVSDVAARAAAGIGKRLPYAWQTGLQRAYAKTLAAGVHPLWFPLASMKLAARLHLARGGRVLNMFLHSSELMPGGSPQVPDEAAAQRLADKIRIWLEWLRQRYDVTGCTLMQLAESKDHSKQRSA